MYASTTLLAIGAQILVEWTTWECKAIVSPAFSWAGSLSKDRLPAFFEQGMPRCHLIEMQLRTCLFLSLSFHFSCKITVARSVILFFLVHNISSCLLFSLWKKCPYSDWIRRDTPSLCIQSECGKMRTRITPDTNTFTQCLFWRQILQPQDHHICIFPAKLKVSC